MPRTPKQFEEIREKTKQKILESSLRLFAERGYHGTSISDIAEAAGISKGLAYNYFDSKQQLVESIFQQIIELGEEYETLLKSVNDPYEQLKVLINFTFDYMGQNEEFWRMYVSFTLQPAIMETAKKTTKGLNDRLIKTISSMFRKIGLPNSKAEAYILGGILDGISFGYFFDKENYPISSVKKKLLEKYSKEGLNKLLK